MERAAIEGIIAPFVIDGAINGAAFKTYVAKVLVAELPPGAIVVMDNLGGHEGDRVRRLIKAAGATLLLLPPCSPGFNPIEKTFAKINGFCARPPNAPLPASEIASASSSISSPPRKRELLQRHRL